jgi:hypothetical protein
MSKLPLTFACGLYDRMLALHTREVVPEGIDLNRSTLEALVRYMADQGLIAKRMSVDDLFVPVA